MKSRNTRSQMTKNRADLDKHRAACTECDQPFNKTQTDPDLCQHKTTNSRRVSTEPKKATRNQLYASTNIPISRSKKNNRTTNLNISSDQVDSLAVSGIDNNDPKQDKEVVIIDSSNEEDDYFTGLQQKKLTRKDKFTLCPKYKDFSYEDYADSDTNTELTPAKEDQKESTKCTPSYKVDSLLNYTDDDFQNGTGSIASCPSDASTVENENYYTRLKEPQTESSTQEKYTMFSNYYKDISYEDDQTYVDDTDTEVMPSPFTRIKRTKASARLSLSRTSKKPLHILDPNDASSPIQPRLKLDVPPVYTRKLPKRSSKAFYDQEPLSPTSTELDVEHTSNVPTRRSFATRKLQLNLAQTDTSGQNFSTDDHETGTSTRSRTASATKPGPSTADNSLATESTKRSPVTRRIKLVHHPPKASAKKPLVTDPGTIATTPEVSVNLKPKSVSSWMPLDITQSPVKTKRRASVTRGARAEPYAAAKRPSIVAQEKDASSPIKQELTASSRTKRSLSVASQELSTATYRRRSSFTRRAKAEAYAATKNPSFVDQEPNGSSNIINQEPTTSSRRRRSSSITVDTHTKKSASSSSRAFKRKASLLTEPTGHVLATLDQSNEIRDGAAEPRAKKSASKIKTPLLTPDLVASDQVDAPRYKSRKISCTELHTRAATNKRTLRKRSSGSLNIDLNVLTPVILEEKEPVSVLEETMSEETLLSVVPKASMQEEEGTDDELLSAEEEDNNYVDEEKESQEDLEGQESIDYLQLIKDDPVLGSLCIKKNELTVFKKVLGEGQTGMVYEGNYGQIPVACKTMRVEVNKEDFYFQIFKELSFAHKLSNCRNVIQYFGWAHNDGPEKKGDFHLVQRLIENGDARKYLYKRGTFYPGEVLTAGICLFSALSDAHAVDIGIVDLKLENYLIDSSGSGFLTDFGSCVEFYGRETVSLDDEEVPWTKSVAAPEMISMHEFSKASDVFMGTLILAELMTAELSDMEFRNKVLRRKAGGAVDFSPKEINARYSSCFDLLAKGLQREASSRPTAEEMLLGLLALKRNDLIVSA
ncbi:hypothetical protein BDF21DRAFT_451955 [Thamnidium elegans]|nr:hypothetical protein BDF21DRAFT_451955 [Thamnidium elegans]